jgi:hypothetical protein
MIIHKFPSSEDKQNSLSLRERVRVRVKITSW